MVDPISDSHLVSVCVCSYVCVSGALMEKVGVTCQRGESRGRKTTRPLSYPSRNTLVYVCIFCRLAVCRSPCLWPQASALQMYSSINTQWAVGLDCWCFNGGVVSFIILGLDRCVWIPWRPIQYFYYLYWKIIIIINQIVYIKSGRKHLMQIYMYISVYIYTQWCHELWECEQGQSLTTLSESWSRSLGPLVRTGSGQVTNRSLGHT